MYRDSFAIRKIEKRIADVELANRYVKKTTRLHQNIKNIALLHKKLNNAVYQHNKFGLFQVVEKELTKLYTEQLNKQFDSFTHIKDVNIGTGS